MAAQHVTAGSGLAVSNVMPAASVRVEPPGHAPEQVEAHQLGHVLRDGDGWSPPPGSPAAPRPPASMMTSRSAMAAASSGSWVTMTHDPLNSPR